MNLLAGGTISGDGLILGDELIPLSECVHPHFQNGQRVTLGFRREAVKVSAAKSSGNAIQLRGEIEALEPDFAQRTQDIYLRSGLWNYTGLCPLDAKLRIGQTVHVEINPERLYFFDTDSGLRL